MATDRETQRTQGKRDGGTAKKSSTRTKRRPASEIALHAGEQLQALAGRDVESITGIERGDDGWTVHVEVVESRRIPDSADLLGMYEVQVDDQGELVGYHRIRRYGRGQRGDD